LLDDFECSIFLTPTTTRHSLVTKHKRFRDAKPALKSNSNKLGGLGTTSDAAIEVSDEAGMGEGDVPSLQEEEDDEDQDFISTLQDIPAFGGSDDEQSDKQTGKRKRSVTGELFVEPGQQKKKRGGPHAEDSDDKKKLGMDVSYDGFNIWGRVLCLIVKQRGSGKAKATEPAARSDLGGRAMMETWIASTQALPGEEDIIA